MRLLLQFQQMWRRMRASSLSRTPFPSIYGVNTPCIAHSLPSCCCYAGTPPLPPGAAAAAIAGGSKQAGGQGSSSRPSSATDPLGLNPVLAAALQLHDTRPPTPLGVADYAAMFRAATPEVRKQLNMCAAVCELTDDEDTVRCRHSLLVLSASRHAAVF
jgi:hypothetical protein